MKVYQDGYSSDHDGEKAKEDLISLLLMCQKKLKNKYIYHHC
jgi:hypothetical protein